MASLPPRNFKNQNFLPPHQEIAGSIHLSKHSPKKNISNKKEENEKEIISNATFNKKKSEYRLDFNKKVSVSFDNSAGKFEDNSKNFGVYIQGGGVAYTGTTGNFLEEKKVGGGGYIMAENFKPWSKKILGGQTQLQTGGEVVTGVNKEIVYENKAVKTTSYVQVPVYEAQYMQVEEETVLLGAHSELILLRLLLKEKENEIEVWRQRAKEVPKESKPFQPIFQKSTEEELELKRKFEKCSLENEMIKQELDVANSKIQELLEKLSFFQNRLTENEDLLENERERAKKAAIPRSPVKPRGGVDPELIRDYELKVQDLEDLLQEKDKLIENLSKEKSDLKIENIEFSEKIKILEQKNIGFITQNENLLKETKEIIGLKKKIFELEEGNRKLSEENSEKIKIEKELETIKLQKTELERMYQSIIKESIFLKDNITSISKEKESLKFTQSALENDISSLKMQLSTAYGEKTILLNEKDSLNNQLHSLESRIQLMESENEGKIKEILIQKTSLEQKIDDLNKDLMAKIKELESLHMESKRIAFELKKQETLFQEQLLGLKKQNDEKVEKINELQQQYSNLNSKFQQISQENESIKLKYKSLELDSEDRIKGLNSKIEGLNSQLNQAQKNLAESNLKNQNLLIEIDGFKSKILSMEEEISEKFKAQMKEYEIIINKLKLEKQSIEKDLLTLKQEITMIKNNHEVELEKQRFMINELNVEINKKNEIWEKEKQNFTREIAEYQRRQKEAQNEFENKLLGRNKDLQTLRQEYELKILSITKEKEILFGKTQLLENQLESLSKENEIKLRDLTNQLAIITKERTVLTQTNGNEKQSLEFLDFQGKIKAMETKYNSLLSNYKMQIEEISNDFKNKLNNVLNEKNEEIKRIGESYNNKQSSYELKIQELSRKYEGIGNDLESKNKLLLSEIEILKGRLNEFEREKAKSAASVEIYLKEIEILKSKIQSYELQINESAFKTQQYNLEISRLKEDYETQIKTLKSEISSLQTQLSEKTSVYERLSMEYKVIKEELENAKKTLEIYENKIVLLSGELSRIGGQMKKKDEELEDLRNRKNDFEISISSYQKTIGESETKIYHLIEENSRNLMILVMVCAEVDHLRGRFVENT